MDDRNYSERDLAYASTFAELEALYAATGRSASDVGARSAQASCHSPRTPGAGRIGYP
ncbi:MAG: hypothetical protein M0Z66_05025 [Thermaerobacter sp.]|nr:hypothetical protein [Thermaerobacter sp.]